MGGDVSATRKRSRAPEAAAEETLEPVVLPTVELQGLAQQVVELARAGETREGFLLELLKLAVASTNAAAGAWVLREGGRPLLGPRLFSQEALAWVPDLPARVLSGAGEALRTGRLRVDRVGAGGHLHLLGVPVRTEGREAEVLSVLLRLDDAAVEPFVAILQLFAASAVHHDLRSEARRADWEAGSASALVEILANAERAEDAKAAAGVVATELARHLGARRCLIGLSGVGGLRCHLSGLSGSPDFDSRAELAQSAEAAFQEVLARPPATHWSESKDAEEEDSTAFALLAHSKLARLVGGRSADGVVLEGPEGRAVGALLVLWGDAPPDGARAWLSAAAAPTAAALDLARRAEPGPLRQGFERLRDSESPWIRKAVRWAPLALAIFLFFPIRDRVGADVRIEARDRRILAAPFDGVLEEVDRAPGDVVRKGERLAALDGREIEWELRALRADRDRAQKQRDVGMARGETSSAQMAALEAERLDLRVRVLEQRVENLEITSPIDGILLSGDLDRDRGSPISKGDALFEVAPLDAVVAELAVPGEEIGRVALEQPAVIRLEAYAGRSWRRPIERLRPRAELRGSQSIFVAEVALENPDGSLRPGMRGWSQILGPRRPLIWVYLRRPVVAVSRWLGW